jgi:hypothetical protein
MHAAEPLLSGSSPLEVEIAIEKWNGLNHQVLITFWQKLFQKEVKHYVLINSVWNKGELPQQWNESVFVPIYEKVDTTDQQLLRNVIIINYVYYSVFFCQG